MDSPVGVAGGMTAAALALVLLSAAGHACWNFLLKRSRGGTAFIGLSKVVEVSLMAPVFAWLYRADVPAVLALWWLPVVGAVLVLANYVCLARAYRHGDLSIVYPVSRGAALALVPLLAFAVSGERTDAAGAAALLLVIAGIGMVQLPAFSRAAVRSWGRSLISDGTRFALLAALAAACYTLWDQRAVRTLAPFTYFFSYTVLLTLAYCGYLLRRTPLAELAAEWRRHRNPIIGVGALNALSYLLMLAALRDGKASYALGARQTSIAFGVLLGWQLLGEPLTRPRQAGALLIVGGCVLFALAR